MTQAELGRRIRKDSGTISRIERDEVKPQPGTLAKLAQALEVPERWLSDYAAGNAPDAPPVESEPMVSVRVPESLYGILESVAEPLTVAEFVGNFALWLREQDEFVRILIARQIAQGAKPPAPRAPVVLLRTAEGVIEEGRASETAEPPAPPAVPRAPARTGRRG